MSATAGSHRRTAPGRSCLECRRRKIGCDRSHPCSYCVKVKVQCTYPEVSASTVNDDVGNNHLQQRLDGIDSRLGSLEKSMSEIKDILLSNRPHSQIPPQGDVDQGMCDIVPDSPEPTINTQNGSRAVFDQPIEGPTLDLPPVLLFPLWQRYLERVDPLVKLFHTPTAQKIFMAAVANRENSNLNALCLVHAVSYAAIMSMSPAKCETELQDNKDMLLTRFVRPTWLFRMLLIYKKEVEIPCICH